jgi:hypothetical protein
MGRAGQLTSFRLLLKRSLLPSLGVEILLHCMSPLLADFVAKVLYRCSPKYFWPADAIFE